MDIIIDFFEGFKSFAMYLQQVEFYQVGIFATIAGGGLLVLSMFISGVVKNEGEEGRLWFTKYFITRHFMWACFYITVVSGVFGLIWALMLFIGFIFYALGLDV